jgi:hypothetical protein
MVRSAFAKLQARISALSDGHAILFATIVSLGGLVLLFVVARLTIDWLEVWLQ